MASDTDKRKREHIETVLTEDVRAKGVTTGFERFFFDHVAAPELDLAEIDLSTSLWNRRLSAPLLISSMTGGTGGARDINLRLAEAAQSLGLAMGVGSQRAALEDPALADTYRVRRAAPDILLFANFGAVQLNRGFGPAEARRAIEMIGADALILHLNPLQEAVQAEGDRDFRGLYGKIETIVRAVPVPVIVKEVGNGISGAVARRLAAAGVAAIDVAGAGGTSWSEVEAYRSRDPARRSVAHEFAAWGIPTALALIEARRAAPGLTIFASGGVRSGVDAAKAIRLGASLIGAAAPVLGSATATTEAVVERMRRMIEELRIACFCTGSRDLAALRRAVLRHDVDWSRYGGA
jgi:isopentenyl-diphosphate delta-isomerase